MSTTRHRRWFLPDAPDVIGMLRAQVAATADGVDAFAAWAGGDAGRADEVRDAEHRCDALRRTLVAAVREAFTTPLPPEDLFALSQDLDRVMNGAKDTVREAEAMDFPPDDASARMAALLAEGVAHLRDSVEHLGRHNGGDGDPVTSAADAAVKSQRHLERVYRAAMHDLLEETDLRVVLGRRELYRRFTAMSDDLVTVADRIWYATVKEA